MQKSSDGPWDKAFLNVIEQACVRALQRTFGDVTDEKIKQALAQGFAARLLGSGQLAHLLCRKCHSHSKSLAWLELARTDLKYTLAQPPPTLTPQRVLVTGRNRT